MFKPCILQELSEIYLEDFETKFHDFIEKGFFSNLKVRSDLIGILAQRDLNSIKDEFVYIKFSDLNCQIRRSESMLFKMAACYIILRA